MSIFSKLERQSGGIPAPAGTSTPRTLLASEDGILLAYGTSPPTTEAGYATGCIFIHVDASSTGFIYVNEGNATTADFDYLAAGT